MSTIESETRSLLQRWFPTSWRQSHGEALIGTVLDCAEAEGRDSLTRAERRDLITSGMREHGLALVPAEVRARASAVALGIGASLAIAQLVGVEWAPWSPARDRMGDALGFGPFVSAGAVVDLLWIIALALGLTRARIATATTLIASMAVSVALMVMPATGWTAARPPVLGLLLMATLALTACVALPRPRYLTVSALVISAIPLTALVLYLANWSIYLGARDFFYGIFPHLFLVGAAAAAIALLFALFRQRATAQGIIVALLPTWLVFMLVIWLGDAQTAFLGIVAAVAAMVFVMLQSGFRLRLDRIAPRS